MLLDNDAFLTQLNKFFVQSKNGGSLFITMKRYDGRTKPIPRTAPKVRSMVSEYSCLIRVTLGNKKISTILHQKDVNRFNQAYSNLLKANIDGLKKRDKRVKGSTNSNVKFGNTKQKKDNVSTSTK